MLQNHPQLAARNSTGFYPYTVDYSCRFNDDDSPKLTRVNGTASDSSQIFTYSGWIKRCALGATQTIFYAGNTGATGNLFEVAWNSDDRIRVLFDGSLTYPVYTPSYHRDPSAWLHIHVACDTTQATQTDRVKVYVNGELQTLTGTFPPQNHSINTGLSDVTAFSNYPSNKFLDCYKAEEAYFDGFQVAISDTAEDVSGVWCPKGLSALSFGTNGAYLKYGNSSSLGEDSSGNNNDFTSSGLAANDQVTDTPTNNFTTWNPLKERTPSTNMDFANGNLQATGSGTTPLEYGFGSILVPHTTSDHWYWEQTMTTVTNECYAGIADPNSGWGGNPDSYMYRSNGNKYTDGGGGAAYGNTFTSGDVIGVRVDGDNLYFYKNGTIQNSGTAAFTDVTTKFPNGFVIVCAGIASDVMNLNAGQQSFAHTVPTGALTICTNNLPEPTLGPNSAENVTDYFTPVLYTGNGTAIGSGGKAVTGVGFQPDMVWIKNRDTTDNWQMINAVRGATKHIQTDIQDYEQTISEGLTSFDSDGFTLGNNAEVNTNTEDYVAYTAKGNGAGVSNTDGTISSTVSVGSSFFSIVEYTGTGANATVGHGLGVAPEFLFVLRTVTAGANPRAYHSGLTSAAYRLRIDSEAAEASETTAWNSTAPTTSVFSVGTDDSVNGSGIDYVAFCFANMDGMCKIGSYTGNSDADGPFSYTGFKPVFTIVKAANTAANWWVLDNTRDTYNGSNNKRLFADLENAESANAVYFDILSNGFKLRSSNSNVNGAFNYIYIAFAEMPFKYANAR